MKRLVPNLSYSEKSSRMVISGSWRTLAFSEPGVINRINAILAKPSNLKSITWDITEIHEIDHIGAQLLWNAWGKRLPEHLIATEAQLNLFSGLISTEKPSKKPWSWPYPIASFIHNLPQKIHSHFTDFINLLGQLVIDLAHFITHLPTGPWKEISANIYHAGAQALGITAIVGFLIGVVLSYLSAQQLHMFGGDIFLVNLLGMSVIRELGPLLAAILVAGRSGSSMTAQIGVMRVTEELNAMQVMGLSHGYRLILPKVVALACVMPLLVVWTDIVALTGGMIAGSLQIGLSMSYFILSLPHAVPIANFWIGIGKGIVFGILIAIIACHYGRRIKPNTESLGNGTTNSVVTSITVVILADAIFAIVLKGIGF